MAASLPSKSAKVMPPVKPLPQTKNPGPYANEPAKASKSTSLAKATTPVGKNKGRQKDIKSAP